MDLYMISEDSRDHKDPHGLQGQHMPQTLGLSPVLILTTDNKKNSVTAQTIDSILALRATWISDINMILGCSTHRRHNTDISTTPAAVGTWIQT